MTHASRSEFDILRAVNPGQGPTLGRRALGMPVTITNQLALGDMATGADTYDLLSSRVMGESGPKQNTT
jgi:hypothetical protein